MDKASVNKASLNRASGDDVSVDRLSLGPSMTIGLNLNS